MYRLCDAEISIKIMNLWQDAYSLALISCMMTVVSVRLCFNAIGPHKHLCPKLDNTILQLLYTQMQHDHPLS